jgi:hypothetical protein
VKLAYRPVMPDDEHLSVAVEVGAEAITVKLQGAAESGTFDVLAATLAEIHGKTPARVVVDLRQLEFATSSCLKVLANWVIGASELDTPYKIQFHSNTKHSWQRRSLHALAAVAPGIVEVSTD